MLLNIPQCQDSPLSEMLTVPRLRNPALTFPTTLHNCRVPSVKSLQGNGGREGGVELSVFIRNQRPDSLFGGDKQDLTSSSPFSGKQSLGPPSTPSSLGRDGAAHGTQSREMNSLLQSPFRMEGKHFPVLKGKDKNTIV